MSKLTLNVEDELIEAAKKEAARRKTSVSKMVSDFLRVMTTDETLQIDDLPPATKALSGMLAGHEVDLDAKLEYLLEKHS